MTMLVHYVSKKDLKAAIGQPLRYEETSMFGVEYRADGWLTVAGRGRPYSTVVKREFFTRVLMVDEKIAKVD